MVVTELRAACARVAAQASSVAIHAEQIPLYAASLPAPPPAHTALVPSTTERRAAAWFWLTMDAINFGSGWFPTLRKPPGRTGYRTISGGLRAHFDAHGAWTATELQSLTRRDLAEVCGQDPGHELMALFAASLNDLGRHLADGYGGDPLGLIASAGGQAAELVQQLAGWGAFRDESLYRLEDAEEIRLPFNKRSQIAAADLARAGAACFADLSDLTMFADNLVPHVLRLDGILSFDPGLVARIDAGELIEHGSAEEVEIRALALHAVEQIVAASPAGLSAAQVDELLWQRGQGPRYKGAPRHRSRCTAY